MISIFDDMGVVLQ